MNEIVIIPARGGSKGLPRKNVLSLCGRPLLAWNVLAAVEACGQGNVYVSTDDVEIASVGESHGANVVWRPEELAGDTASSEPALLHALEVIGKERALPERFLFLQCTSPLTHAEDIRATLRAMEAVNADTALSVTDSHRFLWRPDGHGVVAGINHDARVRLRRQEREPEYVENGAVYAMRTEGFLRHKHRFFGKTTVHVMPDDSSWEIDSLADFRIAGDMLRRRLEGQRGKLLPQPVAAVVFDFDGVLTDDRVLQYADGTEAVICNRADGMGIRHLREAGIPVLILSSEENPVVRARAAKLNVEVLHGSLKKDALLRDWSAQKGLDLRGIVYVGNDINDIGPMSLVGCPVAVPEAHPEVLRHALIVLEKSGGAGAARELSELILGHGIECSHGV